MGSGSSCVWVSVDPWVRRLMVYCRSTDEVSSYAIRKLVNILFPGFMEGSDQFIAKQMIAQGKGGKLVAASSVVGYRGVSKRDEVLPEAISY